MTFLDAIKNALSSFGDALKIAFSGTEYHGFEVRDKSGNIIFSSLDSTWTLLGVYTASANTAHTFTGVPIMPERIVTALMVGQITGDDEAYIHSYSLNGSVLTATPPDYGNTVSTFMMVLGR